MSVIDYLKKAEDIEDQILVGAVRVARNVESLTKVLQSIRQADLGEDSNAVLDELIVISQKAQQIVGSR